jgi:hypothetical protein
MNPCRRCACAEWTLLRKSVTSLGIRRYEMSWFRCDSCDEVSLSYQLTYGALGEDMGHVEATEDQRPASVTLLNR